MASDTLDTYQCPRQFNFFHSHAGFSGLLDSGAYLLQELAVGQELDRPKKGGGDGDNVKVIEVGMRDLERCYFCKQILEA